MKVLRVFNNNVVLTRDELGREVVVTGRGVGYQARPGDAIDEALIARRFVPADNPDSVAKVIADIPIELLALVERLFTEALRELNAVLPPLAIVAVADHIHQAIERVRRGEVMEYPLRAEVAHLHPEELEVAEHLLAKLNRQIETPLPKGEAIALAMHLFHAVTGSPSMEQTFLQSPADPADLRHHRAGLRRRVRPRFDRRRAFRHPPAVLLRPRPGKQLSGGAPAVAVVVSDSNSRAYQLALRIKAVLELRLQHPVTTDEVVYLTMHVARLETGMRTRA